VEGHEVVEFAANGATLDPTALGQLPGTRGVRAARGGFALVVDRVHLTVPALLDYLELKGAPLERLSTHSATLEDVFVALTGRHLRDE